MLLSRSFWFALAAWMASIGSLVGLGALGLDWGQLAFFGYAGLFVVSIASGAQLFLAGPSVVVAIAAGATLDPFLIGLIGGAGTTIGEFNGYLFGLSAPPTRESTTSVAFQRVVFYLQRTALHPTYPLLLFVLAVIPNPIFGFAMLASGAARVPWPLVAAPVFFGKSIRFFLYAQAGQHFL
jgi:membrane protein YqaA with SNARE-associated domain